MSSISKHKKILKVLMADLEKKLPDGIVILPSAFGLNLVYAAYYTDKNARRIAQIALNWPTLTITSLIPVYGSKKFGETVSMLDGDGVSKTLGEFVEYVSRNLKT